MPDQPARDEQEQNESWLAVLAPVGAGMVLDAVDLATYGPIGLWLGMLLGGVVGWSLAPVLRISAKRRWLCALAAGVYCTLPFTGVLPLATLAGLLSRLRTIERRVERGVPPSDAPDTPLIEPEYTAEWDVDKDRKDP